MRTQVRKIGNSLGSIIPAAVIRQLHLKEGAEIDVTAEGGKIVIVPVSRENKRFPFTEQELVNDLDTHTAHADGLAAATLKELGE